MNHTAATRSSADRRSRLSPARERLFKQRVAAGASGADAVVLAATRPARVPLSHAQQRLWFLERLYGMGTQHNMTDVIPLHGEFDHGALVHALEAIVERHEVLRTRFIENDGEAAQVVDAPGPIDVPVVDLSR